MCAWETVCLEKPILQNTQELEVHVARRESHPLSSGWPIVVVVVEVVVVVVVVVLVLVLVLVVVVVV